MNRKYLIAKVDIENLSRILVVVNTFLSWSVNMHCQHNNTCDIRWTARLASTVKWQCAWDQRKVDPLVDPEGR